MTEREQLEKAIAHMETQRTILGDAVVEASLAVLREKLAALEFQPPQTEQQRKQVTILFADISGFTAMSETMDAEDIGNLMNALWQQLDTRITGHGGRIDKHIGDAVMAIWGVESARENDPEQAIRAALAMQQEISDFRSRMAASLPQPGVHMRIGINTGPVLLGEVGTTAEFTAIGDTVNTASRLEEAAPVGGILISHNSYQHVRGIFDVQALDPVTAKGKTEPINVYLVHQAKPRAFHMQRRGVEGVETRMIGREDDLKRLQDALFTTMRQSELQMITIVGEAGVGKSRLLDEFDNWAELLPERVRYFKGQASLTRQNLPYALIRHLFAFRFQIQESDRADIVRRKMEQGIGKILGEDDSSQMKAHFIGQLLGFDFSDSHHLHTVLDDVKQLRDRALRYLCDYFKATAVLRPVVILLEDIHWADDISLDAVNQLAQELTTQRVLIACAARPGLFKRRPSWSQGQSFHTQLHLQNLSQKDSGRLVAELLQKMINLPKPLRELVVNKAEGNPFYIEELIKMLIEDGAIIKESDHWRVEPDRLVAVRVPPTLTGVLQARVDSLPAAERMILQQAAVVGRRFWDSVLMRLSESVAERATTEEIPGALSDLKGKEMIYRQKASAFSGTQEYIFKHAVLREVVYESVLKRVRRIYHALVAEWLIKHSGERVAEYAGLIADHLALAGQTEGAVVYLRQAGEQAARQFANTEAIAYLSRALALAPETDRANRYDLLLAREKVYDLQGEREKQSRDLAALKELSENLADDRRQAKIALRQASYAQVIGDYATVIQATQEAIKLAQAAQDESIQAAGHLQWGRGLVRQGNHEMAQAQLELALSLAKTAQLSQIKASCLLVLGIIADKQGNYEGAKAYYEQSLQVKSGSRRGESAAFINLGNIAANQNDYAQAQSYYNRGLRLKREIGDRLGESHALGNLGNIALQEGDYANARTYYEQALNLKRAIGDQYGEGNTLCNLGRVARDQGDYDQAQVFFQQSLDVFEKTGDRYGESHALAGLGLLRYQVGDDETARDYIQQALSLAQELGARSVQGHALTVLGQVRAEQGDLNEAADAYQQALNLRQELGERNPAMECQAGLARVSLTQGNLSQARTCVEEILSHLETSTLGGAEEPFLVYLTCYRVLRACDDSRAQTILNAAYDLLQERANKISDMALRRSFLENVPAHREIRRAHAQR